MFFGTIYTYPNNTRVTKILAVANLNNLTLALPSFEMGTTNKTPSFLTTFPLGKVPAFSSADNKTYLVESDAIAQYVAESGPAADQLLGRTPVQRAQVRQWISFAENEVMASLIPLVLRRIGRAEYDAQKEESAMKCLEGALGCLETWLEGRE